MMTKRASPGSLFLSLLLLSIPFTAQADHWWVAVNGSDTGSGSVDDPFLTISHAVSMTYPGDTVILEAGSFPAESVVLDDRNITITGQGMDETVLHCGDSIRVSPFFVFEHHDNSSLTDLSIQSCVTSECGAGILCISDATPTLTNLNLNNLQAANGGAACFVACAPTLTNIQFRNNYATMDGGAVWIGDWLPDTPPPRPPTAPPHLNSPPNYSPGSVPAFHDTVFESNIATRGGGALAIVLQGSVWGNNSVFAANTAEEGGAIWMTNAASLILEDSGLYANEAKHEGGAMSVNEGSNILLTGVDILRNQGNQTGGALYCSNSAVNYNECVVANNTDADKGTAIDCDEDLHCSMAFHNSTSSNMLPVACWALADAGEDPFKPYILAALGFILVLVFVTAGLGFFRWARYKEAYDRWDAQYRPYDSVQALGLFGEDQGDTIATLDQDNFYESDEDEFDLDGW